MRRHRVIHTGFYWVNYIIFSSLPKTIAPTTVSVIPTSRPEPNKPTTCAVSCADLTSNYCIAENTVSYFCIGTNNDGNTCDNGATSSQVSSTNCAHSGTECKTYGVWKESTFVATILIALISFIMIMLMSPLLYIWWNN